MLDSARAGLRHPLYVRAALKKLGIKLSDLDIRLSYHQMKPYVLLWNLVTAPLRFRIWSWCSRSLRERFTTSRLNLPKRSFFALRHNERYASQAERALIASFGCKVANS